MGTIAKMIIADEAKADQFILECAEQCHNKGAKDFWGEELVHEIVSYCNLPVPNENKINF